MRRDSSANGEKLLRRPGANLPPGALHAARSAVVQGRSLFWGRPPEFRKRPRRGAVTARPAARTRKVSQEWKATIASIVQPASHCRPGGSDLPGPRRLSFGTEVLGRQHRPPPTGAAEATVPRRRLFHYLAHCGTCRRDVARSATRSHEARSPAPGPPLAASHRSRGARRMLDRSTAVRKWQVPFTVRTPGSAHWITAP